MPPAPPNLARWLWLISGQVQGVGFRPFIFRLAHHAGITGRVLNNPAGVHLEIQGSPRALETFAANFQKQLPNLARIDACQKSPLPTLPQESTFIIDTTQESPAHPAPLSAFSIQNSALVSPVTIDTAVCPDCLQEMRTPNDRRHHHALINCTNCGPRFSIIRNIPYDRPNTTMADFPMCPDCRREYQNPADRRFHAQPVCCPNCGPKLQLLQNIRGKWRKVGGTNSTKIFERTAALLLAGKIVALKGLGGFHLAVRADNRTAVARLRRLKQRDAKPFALMCAHLDHARQLVQLSPAAELELTSFRAPIILAPRHQSRDHKGATGLQTIRDATVRERPGETAFEIGPDAQRVRLAPSIAPGTDLLGIMLPYTPIHHLLWQALAAQLPSPPSHSSFAIRHSSLPPLVMTSGNLSHEPLVIDNADALARLGPMADAILWHTRPIERCVDDSVILDRGTNRDPLPIRRSRGYTPTLWQCNAGILPAPPSSPFPLSPLPSVAPSPYPLPPSPSVSGICLGGELKSTLAVVRQGQIIVSQHLGDLTDARSYAHFQKAAADLIRLFQVPIEFVAHDLHPNYMSTIFARELAARYHARLIPIQHHVAHAYGIMGEHHLHKALALVCDGTGYGTDGSIWGGELFSIDAQLCQRIGRLKPMRLPGGDASARDPRRSAMALLHSAFGTDFHDLPEARTLFPKKSDRQMLAHMITSGLSSPWTSSTGRLFDGIAALLGISLHNNHEAQAPMALEAAARTAGSVKMPEEELFAISRSEDGVWELDLSLLIRWLVNQTTTCGKGRTQKCAGGVQQAPSRGAASGEEDRARGGSENTPWQAYAARVFHRVLAEGWVNLALAAIDPKLLSRLPFVASGGSLCNQILENDLRDLTSGKVICTYFHKSYPPTDAGLAFGQAQYVQAQLLTGKGKYDKRE